MPNGLKPIVARRQRPHGHVVAHKGVPFPPRAQGAAGERVPRRPPAHERRAQAPAARRGKAHGRQRRRLRREHVLRAQRVRQLLRAARAHGRQARDPLRQGRHAGLVAQVRGAARHLPPRRGEGLRGRRRARVEARGHLRKEAPRRLQGQGLVRLPARGEESDVLRRALRADLAGVERRAARARGAKRARALARGVEALDAGLPVRVHGQAAVVVLRADGDLQPVTRKVDAVAAVKGDGLRVHAAQPLDGRGRERAGALQVLPRRRAHGLGGEPRGVLRVVQIHAPAQLLRLAVNRKVHLGGLRRAGAVKGPLVPLAEDHAQGARRAAQRPGQELPLHALRVHGDIARQDLLIAAREVPAEGRAGDAVLPVVQVAPLRPGQQRGARAPGLGGRIDRPLVDQGRPARAQHHKGRQEERQAVVLLPEAVHVQREQAVHAPRLHDQAHHLHPVAQARAPLQRAPLQRLGHGAGGERPDGRSAHPGVVVRLVAHEFAVAVRGEGHAQQVELQERARRSRRLAQRGIAVHAAAREQVARHLAGAVRRAGGQGELVIGLLVAARVARGARLPPLGHEADVRHAVGAEPVRGVVPGAARAHHERARAKDLHLLPPFLLRGGAGGSRRPR